MLWPFIFILTILSQLNAGEKALDQLNENNDHGFWFETDWRVKTSSFTHLTLRSEHRFGANYRIMWYQEYGALFHYDLSKAFCLHKESLLKRINVGMGLAGSEILQRNTRGIYHRVWVLRPFLEYNAIYEWLEWKMSHRFRVEDHFHLRPHYKNFIGYRFRLIFNTPWKFTCWKFNPFLFNEWFFRKNTFSLSSPTGVVGGYHQNRFRIGLEVEPIEDFLIVNIYWQWRSVKRRPDAKPLWNNTYQYGAILNFSF